MNEKDEQRSSNSNSNKAIVLFGERNDTLS